MVKIQIGTISAEIENRQWTCEDADVAEVLNLASSAIQIAGSDPYPDATIAQKMAKMFGGEISHVDDPDFDENVIY